MPLRKKGNFIFINQSQRILGKVRFQHKDSFLIGLRPRWISANQNWPEALVKIKTTTALKIALNFTSLAHFCVVIFVKISVGFINQTPHDFAADSFL
jgi:hypothetical protein